MNATHGHTRLETAREAALLLLAGMGVVLWAPILAIWTALVAWRDRDTRDAAQA